METEHANDLTYLTVVQVAEILECATKTVRKLIAYGLLPAYRLGVGESRAPYRILQADLFNYLHRRKTPERRL